MSIDVNDPRPPYVQVAEALTAAITSGEMQPGERLPSIRELSERYGVAGMTIQHALRIVRERGLIVSWQGRGSYVREQVEEEIRATALPPVRALPPTRDPEPSFADVIRHLDRIQKQLDRLDERVTGIEQATRGEDG